MSEIKKGKIIIAGDLFPVPSNFDYFSRGDVDYLFGEEIFNLFKSADYRICNLEGPLSNGNEKGEKTSVSLKAPTSTIKAIKGLGINCCTLANNHITDAGDIGVIDTMNTLNNAGIQHVGVGPNVESINKSIIFNLSSHIFGLYNVAETMYNIPGKTKPGANLYDEFIVCKELELLKQNCDYLIVIYHGGAEKFRYPSPDTKKRFHRMVDSGANMILSQHTHCIGCEEYYKGAYLLYGQGNFLFRSFNNEYTDTGIILELLVSPNSINIKKHLVCAIEDKVRYAQKQDFYEFDKRSQLVYDDDYLEQKFDDYSYSLLPAYLAKYQANNNIMRILNKFFPVICKKYLLSYYKRAQLLFFLHSYRSEQNREAIISGFNKMLKRK